MILGISEDFSLDGSISLDTELKSTPTSGLFVNTGVHPSITVGNLLEYLPKISFNFAAWDNTKEYSPFLMSRNRSDVVSKNGKIYQSINTGTNQDPETPSPTYWVETNIESLRLKIFLESVKDKVFSDLSLTKRLVNNQYIYEDGDNERTLPNDYSAWVLEPKGSDYVTIRINEMSLQKDGTTPVSLYVINDGNLLETLTLTPNNGRLSFQDKSILLSGKGKFYLAIDSTDVFVGNASIDPLKFDGFVAYTATGTGIAPESAVYNHNTTGNGMGINVTAFLDASKYIENNLSEFGNFIRATFEFMVFQMFQSNPSNRSNRAERIQMADEVLLAELKRFDGDTVVSRYYRERKRAMKLLEKTFDTQLSDNGLIEIRTSSV